MKILFDGPENLKNIVLELIKTGNWDTIENIRKESYVKAIEIVENLKQINNEMKKEKFIELINKYKLSSS